MGEATISKAVGKSFEAEGSSTDRALCARTSSHLSRNVAPESSNVQLRGGVPAQGYPAPRVLFTVAARGCYRRLQGFAEVECLLGRLETMMALGMF